jgi:hypothetical protein
LRRRAEDGAAWVTLRQGNVSRVDPECTFAPQLADLPRVAQSFPHLRDTAGRLAHQTFQERMVEALARRRDRRAVADRAAPDPTHLPAYAKVVLLKEFARPANLPGYRDAEAAGFGGNLLAHGPFETDKWGRPFVPPSRAEPKSGGGGASASAKGGGWQPASSSSAAPWAEAKGGGKAEWDRGPKLSAKATGDGWIED